MFHELKHGDFPAHIAFARYFSTNGYLYKIPHTLFARLVVIVRALLPANILVWVSPLAKQIYDIKQFEISALILMVISYLGLGIIIANRFIKDWKAKPKNFYFWIGIATFTVLLAAPIFLFTFPNRMFLGYVMGNRYDSPTFILSKPFILLLFLGIVDNFDKKWNWKQVFITIIVLICATLAKPSFTITILPSIAILILLYVKQFKKINWLYFIGPIGVTSFILLIGQFIINYSGNRGDRILFKPFAEILTVAPNIPSVLIFILLSIAFPLAITILNWKKVKDLLDFRLAWINFIVAQIYGIVFAEEINFGVLNFWNSPAIGVFILFFVTISFWGKELTKTILQGEKLSSKQLIATVVLILHLICGIIYLIATILNTGVNVN